MRKESIIQRASHIIPDKAYLKLKYYMRMKRRLNLNNPVTYTEKLQWLKINYHNPEWSKLVDKYDVKEWVKNKIGEEYIIPTLGVWDNVDDIDFESLPDQFVLKATHDSGGLVICKDKATLDIDAAKAKLNGSMSNNYFWHNREWPYKNVKPRIIAEKYMVDESGYELKDYKFFCFDGKVKLLFIASGRGTNSEVHCDYFDENFNHLPVICGHPNSDKEFVKPHGFDEMIELASVLSTGLPEARIDFYNINGMIYFGEITFFHWGGLTPIKPIEWDRKMGEWLTLPEMMK